MLCSVWTSSNRTSSVWCPVFHHQTTRCPQLIFLLLVHYILQHIIGKTGEIWDEKVSYSISTYGWKLTRRCHNSEGLLVGYQWSDWLKIVSTIFNIFVKSLIYSNLLFFTDDINVYCSGKKIERSFCLLLNWNEKNFKLALKSTDYQYKKSWCL